MIDARLGSGQRQRRVEVNHGALPHQRDGLQRVTLTTLAQHHLEDFDQADRWDDEVFDRFDCARKCFAPGAFVKYSSHVEESTTLGPERLAGAITRGPALGGSSNQFR